MPEHHTNTALRNSFQMEIGWKHRSVKPAAPNATWQAAFASLVWLNSLADHIGYPQGLCLAQPDPLKGLKGGDLGL